MFCTRCGKENDSNNRFCTGCGAMLTVPTPVEKPGAVQDDPADDFYTGRSTQDGHPDSEYCATEDNLTYVPVPAPGSEPESAPEPGSEPESAPAPGSEPESAPAPGSEPESAPAPGSEPESAPAPEFEPMPKPESNPAHRPRAAVSAYGSNDAPLSIWGYMWRTVLFSIPIVNIIVLFVFAFASGINKNSKNYASAMLILGLICIVLFIITAVMLSMLIALDKIDILRSPYAQ